MLLSELASIATALSGFSVTVSLTYVAVQTRQNVRHARAMIQNATAARTANILLGFMTADAASAWIEGNGGTPTPELVRQRQFFQQCGISIIAMEDYYNQHESGLLSEEQFARGSATFRARFQEPGLKNYWKQHRDVLASSAPNYCGYIDSLCSE